MMREEEAAQRNRDSSRLPSAQSPEVIPGQS